MKAYQGTTPIQPPVNSLCAILYEHEASECSFNGPVAYRTDFSHSIASLLDSAICIRPTQILLDLNPQQETNETCHLEMFTESGSETCARKMQRW